MSTTTQTPRGRQSLQPAGAKRTPGGRGAPGTAPAGPAGRSCDICAWPVDPAALAGGFTTHPGCDLTHGTRPAGTTDEARATATSESRAVDRATARGHERTSPRGVWLIAGSQLGETYPCLCLGYRGCNRRCPCTGRADWEAMPPVCCARRAAETKERASG